LFTILSAYNIFKNFKFYKNGILDVENIIQTLAFIIASAVIATVISLIVNEAWRWKKNVDKQIIQLRKNIDEQLNQLINQLKDISRQLKAQSFVLKAIVDTANKLRKELMTHKQITIDKVIDTASKVIEGIMDKITSAYFELYLTHSEKSSNPDKENRIRFLLEKARKREITYQEVQELQKLLEEQKKKHEDSEDTVGDILAGLLLLYILHVQDALFKKE
jgi:predicted PurR-regulated permease PerM